MYSFSFPNVFGRSMFSKEYADIEHDEIHVYKIFSSLKHIGHQPFIGAVYYPTHYTRLWYDMVLNATFNNISAIIWLSLLLVEETGENHKPVTSHWQTLSHNVVSSTPRHDQHSKSNHWWWQALIVVNPTTIYYHGHNGSFVNAQLVFISTAISEKAFLTFSHRFPC